MTYELSSEVIKILDDLARRFGLVIDWADQNVMPYVTELLGKFISYKIAVNVIPIIIFVIMFGVDIWFCRKLYKYFVQAKKDDTSNILIDVDKYFGIRNYDFTPLSFVISIILVILSIALAFFFVDSVLNLLKLVYIPELYIIEYISQYM